MTRMKSLLANTVWGTDAIPPHRRRYRGLYQWAIPLFNVVFMVSGFVGMFVPFGAVTVQASPEFSHIFSGVLFVSSLIAFTGLALRKPRIEVAGKIPFIFALFLWAMFVLIRTVDEPDRFGTSFTILAFLILPVWRLFDIAYERWEERRHEEGADQ